MKIKTFDVVELVDKNKAIILEIKENKNYFVEVVDELGTTIEYKNIVFSEINKIIYAKQMEVIFAMLVNITFLIGEFFYTQIDFNITTLMQKSSNYFV